jgi:hypothetical protein
MFSLYQMADRKLRAAALKLAKELERIVPGWITTDCDVLDPDTDPDTAAAVKTVTARFPWREWDRQVLDRTGLDRDDASALNPIRAGAWLMFGAQIFDISGLDLGHDWWAEGWNWEGNECTGWLESISGLLDLPDRGCCFLSRRRASRSAMGAHGAYITWDHQNGDLILTVSLEMSGEKNNRFVGKSISWTMRENALGPGLVGYTNDMYLGSVEPERLETDRWLSLWGLVERLYTEMYQEDSHGFADLAVAIETSLIYYLRVFYMLQNRVVVWSERRTAKKRKGQRGRRSGGGPLSPKVRTCKLDLDRLARIEKKRTGKKSSGTGSGTGTPRGAYEGPSYRVDRYERNIWVKEENVLPGEEWKDIKQARRGSGCLVLVNRVCNERGYVIGDQTAVNLVRATPATMG